MKTEEDKAFDEIARKQGSWGGGFQAKRKAAADKFIAAEERKVGERYGYVPKLHPNEWMDEPAQEPVALVIDGVLVKSELPEKYTGHLYTTPPKREWVGLTQKEAKSFINFYKMDIARLVESKLKEKNNG